MAAVSRGRVAARRGRPGAPGPGASTSGRRGRAGRARARRELGLPVADALALREELYEVENLWDTAMHCLLCRHCAAPADATHWLQVRTAAAPALRSTAPALTTRVPSPPLLQYMPMRNRAEVPRLLLEAAQAPYVLEVVGYRRWPAVKPTTEFGKTPALVDVDGAGLDVSHEAAITRFLAKSLGLAGRTPAEEARVDDLYMQYWHTIRNNSTTHAGDLYDTGALRRAVVERTEDWPRVPRFQETHRVNSLSVAARSYQALKVFEDLLEERAAAASPLERPPYLVGDALTYVDLAVFEALLDLAELDAVPDFAEALGLPHLKRLLTHVAALPRIAGYLASPSRLPRYERRDREVGGASYVYVPGIASPRPRRRPGPGEVEKGGKSGKFVGTLGDAAERRRKRQTVGLGFLDRLVPEQAARDYDGRGKDVGER